jgi:hypothetical protein
MLRFQFTFASFFNWQLSQIHNELFFAEQQWQYHIGPSSITTFLISITIAADDEDINFTYRISYLLTYVQKVTPKLDVTAEIKPLRKSFETHTFT